MKLIIGLGNPGPRYAQTRHNAGFRVLEEAASDWKVKWGKPSDAIQIGRGAVSGEEVILAKPQLYMNRSGEAVAPWMEKEGIQPADLVVVVDDLDLPLGRIRLRKQGGSGGHRGMESLIRELGTERFLRLRIGIGRPTGEEAAESYVLSPFTHHEEESLKQALHESVSALTCLITEGLDTAMNRFNQ
jgi:PTH1 family peptidyl-tRNA hydrolase